MIFKIRVAKTAGFCFGVHRALDKVLELVNVSKDPVRTHGPLIHNETVLSVLRARGVHELKPDENLDGKTVVIRAHGVKPDVQQNLRERDASICNATCPRVAQVQSIVKQHAQKGYHIVIIGDEGHAEVDGLLGYAGQHGYVVSGPQDISGIPRDVKICVVAQTTQNRDVFDETVQALKSKFRDCHLFDTICEATAKRQKETIQLAKKSDLMVVVGSTHSANTNRLVDIAKTECRTELIQSEDELTFDMLKGARRIGITAGASTPEWVISRVVNRIRQIGWHNAIPVFSIIWKVMEWLYHKQVLFGISVVLMTAGFSKLLGLQLQVGNLYTALWAGYFWSVLNELAESRGREQGDDRFLRPVHQMQRLVVSLFIITLLPSIVWSAVSGWKSLLALGVLTAGILAYMGYGLSRLPPSVAFRALRIYPIWKNVSVGFLLAIAAIGYPLASQNELVSSGFIYFIYTFLLVLVRMILLDLRTLQLDMISGNITLPVKLGNQKTIRLTYTLLILWIGIALLPVALQMVSLSKCLMIIVPVYYVVYLYNFQHRILFLNMTMDAITDVGMYVAGIMAWLSSVLYL
jgi:(E)-4-hydroxy-3-methyl-but-2-enyl pyrophosphate reductase